MSETTNGTAEPTAPRTVSGARRGADTVYGYLTMLLLLGLLVQFFLAGLGVFGIDKHKIDKASSLDPHRGLAHILAGIALLMLISALVARTSKLAMWGSLALVLLIELAQVALASGGDDHHWLGGLHALNGVLILALAVWMHLASRGKAGLKA